MFAEEYQFVVKDTLGDTVYTEPRQTLTLTSYTFRIVTVPTPTSTLLTLQNLDYDLSVDRNTRTFTLTWNDNSDLISSIRLEVDLSNVTGFYNYYDTSSSVTTGTLSYTVANGSNTWIARAYATANEDGNEYLLDSTSWDYREAWDVFGLESVLMTFLFVMTMVGVGLFVSAEASVIVGLIGMLIFIFAGFYQVSIAIFAGILIAGIIIAVRLYKR